MSEATSDRASELPGFPFWDFSLQFYARPGVAPAALALQDETSLDVNIILLCFWSALAGPGRLDAAILHRCLDAVRDWQDSVVQPIRALRRQLTVEGVVRDRIRDAELAAEYVEQQMLAEIVTVGPESPQLPDLQAAAWNLELYGRLLGVERRSGFSDDRYQSHLKALLRVFDGYDPGVLPAIQAAKSAKICS